MAETCGEVRDAVALWDVEDLDWFSGVCEAFGTLDGDEVSVSVVPISRLLPEDEARIQPADRFRSAVSLTLTRDRLVAGDFGFWGLVASVVLVPAGVLMVIIGWIWGSRQRRRGVTGGGSRWVVVLGVIAAAPGLFVILVNFGQAIT